MDSAKRRVAQVGVVERESSMERELERLQDDFRFILGCHDYQEVGEEQHENKVGEVAILFFRREPWHASITRRRSLVHSSMGKHKLPSLP